MLIDAGIGFSSTKTEARRILDRISKKYNQVFIPRMVLGESCLMVLRKSVVQGSVSVQMIRGVCFYATTI
jgi:predicted nucleic acid-binding protein